MQSADSHEMRDCKAKARALARMCPSTGMHPHPAHAEADAGAALIEHRSNIEVQFRTFVLAVGNDSDSDSGI